MKFLLDTHTLVWTIAESNRLSQRARSIIENTENRILVSSVSLWEIAVKVRIGKLSLGGIDVEDLPDLIEDMDFSTIDLCPHEACAYGRLDESTHTDPFDRMLIWQAINRGLTIVSSDREFKKFRSFGLKLIW